MSTDRKQEFLCSSLSLITTGGMWITQGKAGVWVIESPSDSGHPGPAGLAGT